jgi:hypothetical protein
MVESDIRTDFRRFADDHSHSMIDKESGTNSGTGMDLYAGQPA